MLEFGADVDNFYATSTYRVLKPIGDGLSTIASYLKPTGRPMERVRIGAVRYSATRRRAKASKQADAAVEVNIHDFIGNKTALLGMTRMGKSNTAKIIIARTFAISERQRAAGGRPIGQLIFDPQGEYANPNTQDGTEIAAIGEQPRAHLQVRRRRIQPHVQAAQHQLLRSRTRSTLCRADLRHAERRRLRVRQRLRRRRHSTTYPVNGHNHSRGTSSAGPVRRVDASGFHVRPSDYSVAYQHGRQRSSDGDRRIGHEPVHTAGRANLVTVGGS